MIARSTSKGFENIEHTILAVPPAQPKGAKLHAGEAGGRAGRVMRRQDSLHTSKKRVLEEDSVEESAPTHQPVGPTEKVRSNEPA